VIFILDPLVALRVSAMLREAPPGALQAVRQNHLAKMGPICARFLHISHILFEVYERGRGMAISRCSFEGKQIKAVRPPPQARMWGKILPPRPASSTQKSHAQCSGSSCHETWEMTLTLSSCLLLSWSLPTLSEPTDHRPSHRPSRGTTEEHRSHALHRARSIPPRPP
jgi:hypothetical protein